MPGGLASFGVMSGPGTVTIDHVDAGTGTQSITVVGAPTNAIVNIPPFAPGTFNPVVVSFSVINPALPVDFTLRAASTFHALNIRVRCAETCTPSATLSEGDLFPGGLASFGVNTGPGTVTIDHVNAGTGTQSITVVGVPTNAIVNIPPFAPGTFDPVVVGFSVIDPNQPVDFTLRASSTFHSIFIRVRCGTVTPTPTPNPTPTPTPGGTPTPTPNPTPTPGGGPTTFSGRATAVNATIAGINATLVDTGPLPSNGGRIVAPDLLSASVLGGALTTGLLNANTQGAFDQSRSQAIVYNLNLTAGGNIITSDVFATSTQCTCQASGLPICEGGIFANLRVGGVPVPIVDGGVNQIFNLPNGGFIIVNEQIRAGSGSYASLTVNGLRVSTPALLEFPSTEVIISSAYSDIFCGTQ